MSYLRTLASHPLETLLTASLVLFALVSVRTLSRAQRVARSVLERGGEPAAELWSRTQVRIEWCILLAQCLAVALSVVTRGHPVAAVLRFILSALLTWCVLANKRTCEQLQAMGPK